MDGTVRCRYSGAPFCPLVSPAKERTPSGSAALDAARARRKPLPHREERPP